MLQERQLSGSLTCEAVTEAAGHVVHPRDDISNVMPATWTVLPEQPETAITLAYLAHLAHQAGYRQGHAEASEERHAVVLTVLAGILAIALLAAGFFAWQLQTGDAAINRIYERVSPAVAVIRVTSAGVTGTGIVFDRRGYLLTNYHVIEQAQGDQDLAVQLPALGEVPAKIVGYDIATDLAVLKIEAPPERLTAASFGYASRVHVGDLAIAIGNPFGLSQSLTVGHISAVGRRLQGQNGSISDVEGALQTDAAINPGNSGGPLLNSLGQVIGINTRIESPSGGSVGLGFAIPSDTALRVARDIVTQGNLRQAAHPMPEYRPVSRSD